jgi:biotin carboxylase
MIDGPHATADAPGSQRERTLRSILVLCATERDRRELPLEQRGEALEYRFHDYATAALERLVAPTPTLTPIGDPNDEIERILATHTPAPALSAHRIDAGSNHGAHAESGIDGVVSTDDYPGSAVAAIVARRMGLPGPDPGATLLAQHKYLARLAQREACASAVPAFELVASDRLEAVGYPCFVKPVKSFFSVGASRVDDPSALADAVRRATLPDAFFAPLAALFERYAGVGFGERRVMAEELLAGQQVTLEGYVHRGAVRTLGVTDSVMFPGTLAFERFDYPSRLPDGVQQRMAGIAAQVIPALGFDHGLFNIELMYDARRDDIRIIEVNPRMASQFADLHEKVDGCNTYELLVDLALAREPHVRHRSGRHAAASSCVLRRFDDALVVATPGLDDIERLHAHCPDVRIEIFARPGKRLSHEMQDNCSYRYGIVNIGGRDAQDIGDLFEYCRRMLPFTFTAP